MSKLREKPAYKENPKRYSFTIIQKQNPHNREARTCFLLVLLKQFRYFKNICLLIFYQAITCPIFVMSLVFCL